MERMNRKSLKKLHPLLKIISKLSNEEKQVLLRYLNHEGCRGIYECVHNGLTNPTLSPEDKDEMRNNLAAKKNWYRKLLKETDPVRKQQALLQVGEGVGLILEKVVPLLDNYLSAKK